MARGEVLDDIDYTEVRDTDDSVGLPSDKDGAAGRYVPISKKSPADRFRILKNFVLADLEASNNWREQATQDMAFVAGEQYSNDDRNILEDQGRPIIVFNRVETILKAIAGMQINGRHEIQYLPRNNNNTAVNEVLTAASKWMADGCDAEDEQSAAFQECCTTGLGVTESRFSFEEDPAGAYIEEQFDAREFVWDRTAQKKNLVDARRMGRIRRMPFSDAATIFPGKNRVMLDASWANDTFLGRDTLKSLEERRIRDSDNTVDDFDDRNEVTLVCLQWWEKEPYWRIADETTNEIFELDDDEYQRLQVRMMQLGRVTGQKIDVVARRAYRKVYYQAFLGNEELSIGRAPLGNQFSWGAITGSYDKKKRQWYGIVRVMRDPQMWANKFLGQIMQIMNTTAKGGIIAEVDAFDDQREAEETYAQPNAITWVTPGSISSAKPKIMPKPGMGDAAAYVNLLQFAISSIKDVTGINLELLGQQDQNQPGILEHMRKQAGMTVLATQFDALRRFLKIVGRKRLYIIQNRMSDGRLIRVVGQDYEAAVPLAKDATTGTYDVIVDDAPTSPNQKEANWQIMQPMLVAFKDQLVGSPEVLAMILEYSPLPERLVQGIKRVILQKTQDPQAQAEQQQMKHLAVTKLIAEINKDQSIAEMNNSKAGATTATASYDLAMAQNLLAKNDTDGFIQHLDAMSAAAKAERDKAEAAKAGAQAHREMIGVHTDVAAHQQNMRSAQVADHAALQKAFTDRLLAHVKAKADHHSAVTERIGAANEHIATLAGAHADLARANRDRVGAVVDQRMPAEPAE